MMSEESSEASTQDIPARARRFPRPLFVLISIMGFFVVVTTLVYRLSINNPFVRTMIAIIPYPAVTMKGAYLRMSTYANEQDALSHFLETTGFSPQTSPDVFRRTVLDALTNKTMIQTLAREADVKIDDSRVNQYYSDVIAREESEEAFEKKLRDTFNWDPSQFKKRIVESIVLAFQMSEFVSSNIEIQRSSRLQIEQAEVRLATGEDFFTVAKNVYGNSKTVMDADLGYHVLSELPPQWLPAASLEKGQRTGILESTDTFFLLYIEDRIESQESTQVHLLTISVPKKTLEMVVKARLEKANVRYFVK